MKVIIDFYVCYRTSGPHNLSRYPFEFPVEHEGFGRPYSAYKSIEAFIKKLCSRRDTYAGMDTFTFFRRDERPLVAFGDVTHHLEDVLLPNMTHLIDVMIECLNLYMPENLILSFIHYLFKAFPCCPESYNIIMNEASRQKKRLNRYGRKKDFVMPRIIMRKSDYSILRHQRDRFVSTKAKDMEKSQNTLRDQYNEVVAAHIWNEGPCRAFTTEPLVYTGEGSKNAGIYMEFYGLSPYVVEVIRGISGHRATYAVADYKGSLKEPHAAWADQHSIWLNIYAAHLLTTAVYNHYENEKWAVDFRFMAEIWETVEQLARLNADSDGISILKKRAEAMFNTGVFPIICNL